MGCEDDVVDPRPTAMALARRLVALPKLTSGAGGLDPRMRAVVLAAIQGHFATRTTSSSWSTSQATRQRGWASAPRRASGSSTTSASYLHMPITRGRRRAGSRGHPRGWDSSQVPLDGACCPICCPSARCDSTKRGELARSLAWSSDAGGGTRTRTARGPPDFKSGASHQFRHPGAVRLPPSPRPT